jgi:putative mRNA 3-end processing factor
MAAPLIVWTARGLYCPDGDFYIDPHRAVDTAVVTHGHSDHARRGSKRYFTVSSGVGILKCRLGANIQVHGVPYGVQFKLGGVTVSFHSAGHILGSAQVRVQRGPEVWVASGDYKRDPDPSCDPFEVVRCDTFITEATFGTPKYVWSKTAQHGRDMFEWWQSNAREGQNSVIFGYSLGKAQRILAELAPYAERPIWIYDTIAPITECYRQEGRILAPTRVLPREPLTLLKEEWKGELVLAPPSILQGEWLDVLRNPLTAFASGWMQGGGNYFRGGEAAFEHGFVMSDHADWNDLNRTIEETGAQQVFIQHRDGALVRHLRKKGIQAHPISELELDNFIRLPPVNLSLF